MTNQVRTSEVLASAARFAAVMEDMGLGSLEELARAVACAQADLAGGRTDLEDFVNGWAVGLPYAELIEAAEQAQPIVKKDGSSPEYGDLLNAYSQPAVLYGIALGLCLSEGVGLKQQAMR